MLAIAAHFAERGVANQHVPNEGKFMLDAIGSGSPRGFVDKSMNVAMSARAGE
jgi:hypothetical protein